MSEHHTAARISDALVGAKAGLETFAELLEKFARENPATLDPDARVLSVNDVRALVNVAIGSLDD